MLISVNGINVDLNEEEIKELESVKVPKVLIKYGKSELVKVYRRDGTYNEQEGIVYRFA